MADLASLERAISTGDADAAQELVRTLLAQGVPGRDVLEGMVRGIAALGKGMETGEVFLAEVILAAETFKRTFPLLEQAVKGEISRIKQGRVVIGTIFEDIHDIGKNLVATMLEASGFDVLDLGVDVSAGKFVQAVKDFGADIVGISAEITTTMLGMREVIEELKAAGLRDKVKVMVGGPPLTPEYARTIGADGYGKDCFEAVALARDFMAQLKTGGA